MRCEPECPGSFNVLNERCDFKMRIDEHGGMKGPERTVLLKSGAPSSILLAGSKQRAQPRVWMPRVLARETLNGEQHAGDEPAKTVVAQVPGICGRWLLLTGHGESSAVPSQETSRICGQPPRACTLAETHPHSCRREQKAPHRGGEASTGVRSDHLDQFSEHLTQEVFEMSRSIHLKSGPSKRWYVEENRRLRRDNRWMKRKLANTVRALTEIAAKDPAVAARVFDKLPPAVIVRGPDDPSGVTDRFVHAFLGRPSANSE